MAFGALLLLAASALVCVLTLGSSAPVFLARLPEETSPAAADPATPPLPPRREPPASREAEPAPSRQAEASAPVARRAGAEIGPPAFPGEISGRVLDTSGRAVAGAYVALGLEVGGTDEDGVALEPAFEAFDSTRTDAKGQYSLSPKRTGSGIVRVEARRFEPASERVEIPDVATRQKIDFQLIPLPISVIRGRLLSPEGAPLNPWVVEALFPGADARAARIGGRTASALSWIHALTDPYCAWAGASGVRGEAAVIHPETSSFEIEVPLHAERIVTAISSARILASQPWRDGDPEVVLFVDASSRFQGRFEAQVLDARTGATPPATVAVVRVPGVADELARLTRVFPAGRFSSTAPAGIYDLEARAPGFAAAATRVEVRDGGTTDARLSLDSPSTVRLFLDPVDGWLPEPGSRQVRYRDSRGAEVRTGIEAGGGEEPASLLVRGLPPGEGYLVLAGNLLRIGLSAGTEVERRFPLRKPRRLLVRFRPRDGTVGGDGLVECSASLATAAGLPVVEETKRLRPRRDGSCLLWLVAPPGDYGFRMEVCGGKEIRRPVTVVEAETTWLEVESP
ncbi:MAG: carboxypeptidase-like regulatory domain-containing protein [Planctomycetes bacterium]|nr:carboxypeptidase-like regulatory domain-containing protein [Planctomycetota bacterium]